MESCETECCVRGYHVYQRIWGAAIGEVLDCDREPDNAVDHYAVKDGDIVGHLPRTISRACSLFIRRGGTVRCRVTGPRKYSADLPQGGMEIPCLIICQGEGKDVKKLIKLFLLQN